MRISRIDNLKGIGILLIVLGHCKLPPGNLLTSYLFSFHVALFFILSGFLFDENKYDKITKFFKNRFLRLVIPFFAFNIIYFAINKSIGEYAGTTIKDFAIGVFYGDYLGDNGGIYNNTGGFNLGNISTWFLTALFTTSFYYFFLHKITKSKKIKLLIAFIFSIIVYIESKLTNFRSPWGAEIAFMMLLFYSFGNIFKDHIKKFVEKINSKYLLYIIPVIGIHLLLINMTNISMGYYGNYALLILDSLLGFITILVISKQIGDNKILSFFGKNSIIILGFEWIKIFVEKYTDFFTFCLLHFEKSFLFGFTQFFITIIALVPIIFIINNFFPFILGMGYKYSMVRKYLPFSQKWI
ncbi:MAG: acyltransferase family protein [Candidatus Gracilibacteria bacterium]|nr:acyltransferase family protein [Candidatus Gracilibacteria bacterium]